MNIFAKVYFCKDVHFAVHLFDVAQKAEFFGNKAVNKVNNNREKQSQEEESMISRIIINQIKPVKTSLRHERKSKKESNQTVNSHCHGLLPALLELRKLI